MNTVACPSIPSALVVALALAACGDGAPTNTQPPPLPVLVTTIRPGAQPEQRVLTATVRARVETELGFRTGGRVIERLVDVGDRVKAGQVLARLDAADHALGMQAATDQVRAAKVDAEQAAADEARLRRLLADGSVGSADHERQKARADAAAAQWDEARRKLDLARNRVGHAALVAPYAGIVTALQMEVGKVVSEGQPAISLARDGEREIVADLPEPLVGRVHAMRATATPWHEGGKATELRLREVSPMASSATGTFRVRYAIADGTPPQAWPLGSTARLQLAGDAAAGVSLPPSALVKTTGAVGVWVIDARSKGLVFQPVQVQAFEADAVRVAGLEPGVRVVTVGAQKLDPSMKVTPVQREGSP